MNGNTIQVREPDVTLPPSAPLVRITAGLGSAGQKTWNLRRPVTLLGSRRPAHIVLHDRDIAKVHCVIVNTGEEVLIKDLHTEAGTFCNDNQTDLMVLSDGDTLRIGATRIQVAIRVPEPPDDSACGLVYADPTRFVHPVQLQLLHTSTEWTAEQAAVLIGRQDGAGIQLDHEDVSHRHALLFRFCNQPAVLDLGSRSGIWINGQRSSVAQLVNDDVLTIGPFGLSVHCAPGSEPFATTDRAQPPAMPTPTIPDAPIAPPTGVAPRREPVRQLSDTDVSLESIEGCLSSAWERLNAWQASNNGTRAQSNGRGALETSLDTKDAELRGWLHDVNRLHENVAEREREATRRQAKLQEDRKALDLAQQELDRKQHELDQREADVRRRENVLAQRWTRIRSASCSNCGKPIQVGGQL